MPHLLGCIFTDLDIFLQVRHVNQNALYLDMWTVVNMPPEKLVQFHLPSVSEPKLLYPTLYPPWPLRSAFWFSIMFFPCLT